MISGSSNLSPSRRVFLLGAISLATASVARPGAAAAVPEARLVAGPGQAQLLEPPFSKTDVWAYDGTVPGPTLRLRQNVPIRILVENRLAEATTVHWHGVRVPNAMDGVPYLTQPPIAPGQTFAYEFAPPDAGTFWYHPHERSFEQVARGLYGALIVEEQVPILVDRELTWVLADWRLGPDGSINEDFGNHMDVAMSGRIGTTVTINGRQPQPIMVRAGERLRLRLINAAGARIFGLEFSGHAPRVIALDGQPVEPHAPEGGRIVLGPAMRADLILDMAGSPGQRFAVADSFYPKLAYRLTEFVYADDRLRDRPLDAGIALPPNPLTEPDLATAERHELVLGGGMMMGGMTMGGMTMGSTMGGGMMGGAMPGMNDHVWTINGVSATEHTHAPLLLLKRGRSYVLAIHNDTMFHHPIHLHGHAFRVISRNGEPTRFREWRDTVLTSPRKRVEIAFVADKPGDWMIHCHVLEHQAGGMMATARVE